MAIRFYLMDKIYVTNPTTGAVTGKPEYPFPAGSRSITLDYGRKPVYLVALDTTPEEHVLLAAHADVDQFPESLDLQLGSNLSSFETTLENRGFPADTLVGSDTYRTALRLVTAFILVSQRYAGLAEAEGANPDMFVGVTFNTRLRNAPSGFGDRLFRAMSELGYHTSALTLDNTIRQVMGSIGSQDTPITFLGVTV
jgi:hypothetical protein